MLKKILKLRDETLNINFGFYCNSGNNYKASVKYFVQQLTEFSFPIYAECNEETI